MKIKTNKAQRDYMEALALVKVLDDEMARIECEYITAHNIVNPDGETPERVCCILNEDVFDKANEETAAEIQRSGLENEYNKARKALDVAEENLVQYALSIAPAGIRATLERGANTNYTIRKKLIDAVYHLDVSTIPT